MPQENYTLIGFDWVQSLENLRKSHLIMGDLNDDEIARTKGVLKAHVKIKGDTVAFGLSEYGNIQISTPNNDLLRRARSIIGGLVVCSRWMPKETDESRRKERTDSQLIRHIIEELRREYRFLGAEEQSHEQKDAALSISDAVLSRIWDELFELRSILHNPTDQDAQNREVLRRLRSLVQLLPQNMKDEIMPSVDNFPEFSKEEEEKLIEEIKKEIGPAPILLVCGVPFGDVEIERKVRKQHLISMAFEKKIEEIIGKVSSKLHEALKDTYII